MSQQPTSHFLKGLNPAGFHKLHYTQWGAKKDDSALICVHGLSRNCRDFDHLAKQLLPNYWVNCLDVVGRGNSDWLIDAQHYNFQQYLADCNALIARLGVEKVDWIGTSMGGLIGMLLAAQPNTPIRRLILNDVSPFISGEAIKRIRTYVSIHPEFNDTAQAKKYIKQVMVNFGELTEDHWDHITEYSTTEWENGKLRLHYDPNVASMKKMTGESDDINLWPVWQNIKCPVFVMRGADSDVLTAELLEEMKRIRPIDYIEFDNVGHAPMLMSDEQMTPIVDWLENTQ